MTFLLDTNVVSETRRKRPDLQVLSWFRQADPDSLYISVLTLGEIAKGVARHSKRDKAQAAALRRWLDATRAVYSDRIVPIDAEIPEAWGELGAKRPLPVIDGLLAATALVRRLPLVTRDIAAIGDTGVVAINPWEG